MTITTANRPQARATRRLPAALRLAPFALGALLLSAESRADWKFSPSLGLTETYSDNIWLETDRFARREFITDASPSFVLSNNGRRLKLSASADWHVFAYSKKGLRDSGILPDPADPDIPYLSFGRREPGSTRAYRAQANAMLVDELLYLDARADRRRQPISAFAPLSTNEFSNVNRDEMSSWSISPYLQHRFGSKAALSVRFARDSVKGGVTGFGDSMASTRSIELASAHGGGTAGAGTLQSAAAGGIGGIGNIGGSGGSGGGLGGPVPGARNAASGNVFDWTLLYNSQDLTISGTTPGVRAGRTSSQVAMASGRWRVAPTVSLTADLGHDRYSYETRLGTTSGMRWSLGSIWTPSPRTSLQASFGHRYFGKTGLLAFSHRTRNTVWSIDYNDDVTTTRSQFLLPASLDTAAMLDRLFAGRFPDPVLRQQAVQSYMATSGLPPSLTESINFLSNRYFRDRRLRGAVVWKLSKTDVALSVYHDQRNGLSIEESDSVLLGSQSASLNENTRSNGASASVNHNLSSRTSASAALDISHARSVVGNLDNRQRTMRLSLNRRIGARSSASLQLRHATGTLALGGRGGFHENAVVANFTVKY